MGALSLDPDGKLKIPEREVQKACVQLLRSHGWLVFETHSHDARKSMGEGGQPDLVAVRPCEVPSVFRRSAASVLLIECKRRDGRVSQKQRAWHADAEGRGFRVLVVRDVGELEAALRGNYSDETPGGASEPASSTASPAPDGLGSVEGAS